MERLYMLLMGLVMFFACYEAIFVYRKTMKSWAKKERVVCLVKVPVLTMLVSMLVCMINCVVDLSVLAGF